MRPFLQKYGFSSLLLLFFGFSLLAGRASAQIPPPQVPCNSQADPEFHSLRPYQASPCGGEGEVALFCGNKVIIKESMTAKASGCKPSLKVHWENVDPKGGPKDYWIDISETKFPIAGNTEQVKNSQNPDDQFDDARKVNEYASWYLNGVINRAEYGNTKNTDAKIINFSGPIQKLFPSLILEAQRIQSVKNALTSIETQDDDGKTTSMPANHNQIVVCASKKFLGISNRLIGRYVPHECYSGNGSKAKEKVYRLADWENHLPPLPWDEKYKNNQEAYQKDRCEWEGGTYLKIPFTKLSTCIDNPFNSNEWADLYPYIPLASTADVKKKMPISSVPIIPSSGTVMTKKYWAILENGEPVLYFPHTAETAQLSEFLNKSYLPQATEAGELDPKTTENNASECRIVNVKSNEGDDLFPIHKPGDIGVEVYFLVEEIPLVDCIVEEDPETGEIVETGVYSGLVTIEIPHSPVKVPWGENIWKSAVAGSTSTFRRIFPKIEKGAPISCIADIPSETKAVYTPVVGTKDIDVAGPVHSVNESKMDPQDARIYFPHWGSIHEYFLKGIQTALRPRGFGSPITNGTECDKQAACGELPKLPKASGPCTLGKISPRVGNIPQSLKDIIEAAAETYKVPPNLILGVMYGEGLFNPGRFNWTDENVKNWATCVPIPGCSTSGADNFIGFFSSDWASVVPHIEPDLKKLDPNRQKPSQCNLLDAIYGLAWNLHDSADGGMPFQCFGINLNASVPSSCSWNDNQYESAIKVHESGYTQMCLTKEGSCVTGGGTNAACPTGGDTCETINNRYSNPSHNGCVWDVAHGN